MDITETQENLCLECQKGLSLNDEPLREYVTEFQQFGDIIRVPVNTDEPFSIQVDYEKTDNVPDFPNLQDSVETSGCNFCSYLVKLLEQKEYCGPSKAKILFQYIWYPTFEVRQIVGLRFLQVRVVYDKGKSYHDLFFTITTPDSSSYDLS